MFSKRRALSGVLVTIIIMVASIVLAAGVVLYGTTLFQGGAQQESISVSGVKLWVHGTDSNGLAWGAFVVRNTGDKVLSVDKINVRGTTVPFPQWYPDTTVSSIIIQQVMKFPGWLGTGGMLDNTGTNTCPCVGFMGCPNVTYAIRAELLPGQPGETGSVCANSISGPVGLDPGDAMIMYFKINNGTLSALDGGATTNLGIFAGKVGTPLSVTISSKI